nr:uncharacterized protein DDB_G0271670 isoform X3 [Drosophila suzukii]
MTFYWWSHWFWITLILSVNLLSSHVHTYPSQEAESQHVRTTKLYQTTVTQTWGTATQSNIMDLTHRPTTSRPVVTPSYNGDHQLAQVDEVDQAMELQEEQLPLNDRDQEQDENSDPDREQEQEQEQDEDREQEEADQDPDQDADADTEEAAANEELAQFEFKRSADFTSEQLNNFTNFSSSTSTNGSSSSTTTTKPVAISSSSPATTTTTTSTTTTRAVAGSTTTPRSGGSASTSTVAGSAATPSTPKINTEWLSDELLAGAAGGAGSGVTAEGEGEKAPFTLENANKEDELRRAESEHRSRKSKVLSAEYKHINRYINFSSDTKSLLTRSASAAPSVAGGVPGSGFYDGTIGDEGNISSEALAIQRTYFLDAGAISAICFTVFGVCCTVGTIGIVLYRRRYLNKPQALSEPDSSVYIDDSTMRVSDNSDEMYSLDNDSFLNSLEAMTIQNYWTDTVKHTKL